MSLLVEAYGSKFQPERQPIHHTFGVGDKFAGEWEPSWYTGIASAPWNGIRSAWYETKSSLQVGLGELPIDDDWKNALNEWAKDNRQQALEYAPDPELSSAAAQVVYGISKDLTKVAGAATVAAAVATTSPVSVPALGLTAATAGIYGLNVGVQQTQELLDKGVDAQTAKEAGSLHGLASAGSVMIPGGFGLRRLANAAAGGSVAASTFMAENAALNQILTYSGYEKLADEFDAFDPIGLGVSAIFGGAVGAWSGKSGTTVRISTEANDAARLRGAEIETASNLAEDFDNGAQMQRGLRSLQQVRSDVDAGKRPSLKEDSVNPEKIKEIQEESARRLQERYVNNEKVLQNRDRSSASSIAQMASIAGSPDYGRLGFSRTFTDGAPVVAYAADIPEVQRGRRDYLVAANGKRYEVQYAVVEADQIATSNSVDGTVNPEYGTGLQVTAIAGNGRAAGLKAAYERGTADNYRAELTADNVYGINPELLNDMHSPVLVRIMRDEDVTADIGDVTNQSSSAQLSVTEQAQTDAQRIDLSTLDFNEDGSISPESVRQFTSLLPAEERSRLIDSNGFPTQDAQRRLDNAIFQAVYQNTGLTDLLSTTEKTGISRMVSAFRQAAPRLLQLEGTEQLDFRPALTEVLAEIQAARASGKKLSLEELARQEAIGRSPEAEAFLRFLVKNEAESGGVRGIVDTLSELASFARQNADTFAQGDTMFGPAIEPTRVDLMREFSRLTGVPIREADFVSVKTIQDAVKASKLQDLQTGEGLAKRLGLPYAGAVKSSAVKGLEAPKQTKIKNLAAALKQYLDSFAEVVDGRSYIRGVDGQMVEIRRRGLNKGAKQAGYDAWFAKDAAAIPYVLKKGIWSEFPVYKVRDDGTTFYRVHAVVDIDGIAKVESVKVGRDAMGKFYYYLENPVKINENAPLIDDGSAHSTDVPPQIGGVSESISSIMNSGATEGELAPQPALKDTLNLDVKDGSVIRTAFEKIDNAQEKAIIRDNAQKVQQYANADSEMRMAVKALEDNRQTHIQLNEQDASINGNEFLNAEMQKAADIELEADKGVSTSVLCALLNGGLNGID